MKRDIVITGLGCVSPLGLDVKTSWENAAKGKSGIDRVTKFDITDYRSQMAGEVRNFDPTSIVAPKDVKKNSDFILYALVAAQQALNDAQLEITPEIEDLVGVSVGVGIGGLPVIEKSRDMLSQAGPRKIGPFFIPMTISNLASGQISIYFKAKNYSATTVSACSSSNHSIGDAARIIERGDAEIMIVGGSESCICPLAFAGFGSMRALSTRNDNPSQASRPYDIGRDGFVIGEGSGILILESKEFAQKRGARIYCELSGYGFSSDASHITMPSAEGPAKAMKMAIKDAGVNFEDVDYINTHGTSTPIGDINEIKAIKAAFGNENAKKISLSSTKSLTGHLLGGAGAVEAILSINAMQDNLIPPTINVDQLDPECDLDITPNIAKEKKLNVVMSNGFGFGGTNASLVFKK